MISTQKEITEAIKEIRPKLSEISPLVAKIVIGVIGVNLLIGAGFATTQVPLEPPLVIASNTLAFQIWGSLFIVIGLVMALAYLRNDWHFIRRTLIVGILIKFTWLFALVIRYFSGEYTNPTILVIWLFLAYVEMVTFIHFMPTPYLQKGAQDAE